MTDHVIRKLYHCRGPGPGPDVVLHSGASVWSVVCLGLGGNGSGPGLRVSLSATAQPGGGGSGQGSQCGHRQWHAGDIIIQVLCRCLQGRPGRGGTAPARSAGPQQARLPRAGRCSEPPAGCLPLRRRLRRLGTVARPACCQRRSLTVLPVAQAAEARAGTLARPAARCLGSKLGPGSTFRNSLSLAAARRRPGRAAAQGPQSDSSSCLSRATQVSAS